MCGVIWGWLFVLFDYVCSLYCVRVCLCVVLRVLSLCTMFVSFFCFACLPSASLHRLPHFGGGATHVVVVCVMRCFFLDILSPQMRAARLAIIGTVCPPFVFSWAFYSGWIGC